MPALRRRKALHDIFSDESRVLRLRTEFLSRVRLLRRRDDDQLRNHGVCCAGRVFAFAIDAGNVARVSGIKNRNVDVRGNFTFVIAGANDARVMAGVRLLG